MVQSTEQFQVFKRAVREKPYQARVFGPPNWLVLEGAGAEKRAEVVGELRREYGLDRPVNVADHVASVCSLCHERPPQAGRRVCAGCRKAAERAGRRDE